MLFGFKLCRICRFVVLIALAFGLNANEDGNEETDYDCVSLKTTVNEELDKSLRKKLAVELSNRKIELIKKWQSEFDTKSLLNDELLKSTNKLLREEPAAEQAEINYQEAHAELLDKCPQ